MSGGDQARDAGRGDDDVGGADVRGEVARAGVAQRHGGVLGAPGEQQPSGRPTVIPRPIDDDLGAGDRHVVAAEQLDDADRRARQRRPAR